MSRSLGYDAGSRIATQNVSGATRTYSYDATDQLLGSTGSYSYSAGYDAVGNRTNADNYSYAVNNVNAYPSRTQLVAPFVTQSFGYDANGNLNSWGGANLRHDSQGQLTNLYNGASYSFSYDYRRLRVSENSKAFTYDARGNLLQMADGANTNDYVYADGIDHAVLLRRNGTLYALVTDHLGSVIAIFDSSGNLVQSYDYTSFGKTSVTGTDVGNTLGFTGREMDGSLYYYRNRWYSPELGRFLEPDPIGLRARDVNLYRYVRNNSITYIDPLGLINWRVVIRGTVTTIGGAAVITAGVLSSEIGIGAAGIVLGGWTAAAGIATVIGGLRDENPQIPSSIP